MRARAMVIVLCMAGCAKPAAGPSEPGTGPGPSGTGGAGLVAPTVPAELAIPEGNKLTFMAAAKGVQIYECAADAVGALSWKLHAPRADLLDDSGASVGIHYGGVDKGLPPGPYWESTADKSRVHGKNPATAPHEGSIALVGLE